MANNYLNSVGKMSARWANSTGACLFLYLAVGKALNFVFLEEEELWGENAEVYKAAIFGGVTGFIYKSTRGWRPMLFATLLGIGAGSTFTYLWTKDNALKRRILG